MSSTNFGMMVRVHGEVSVEQINFALRQIRVRHVALISPMERTPDHQVDYDLLFTLSVRENCSESDWVEVAQSELATPFEEQPPYARFTLLRRAGGFDLLAIFHHYVCDGMSGMFLLRDVLQVLAQPDAPVIPLAAPPREDEIKLPDSAMESPRLQKKVQKTVEKLRRKVLREKEHQAALAQKQKTTSRKISPLVNQFVILPTLLTPEQTAALMARCKKEQVSVHAAICVAWMRAWLAESGAKKTRRIVSSPVNLRKHLSPPMEDTSGGFLTIVETSVDCAPEKGFWDVAREFKRRFRSDTNGAAIFFQPALFGKIFTETPREDVETLLRVLFYGPVKYDYSMTNLGLLPIPEQNGSLRVEAFYGPLVNSSQFERTVGISTVAGRMSLSLLFRQSKMRPASGKALMDRAIGLLLAASAI